MNNGKPQQSPQRVEIVHAPQASESPTDIDLLAVIERRNEMMSRILDYAIRATHPGQWVDQNGRPYPTAPAAEVMARRCAVSIKNVQTNKVPSSDDKGPFYMYVVTATSSLPGGYDSIEAMGTCSSRDTFLGTETKAGRQLSDIDEGNILKAAYSNMLVNAITRLLGVRNLSWERLAELGINQGLVAKVEYNSGAKGGSADSAIVMKFGNGKGKTIPELNDEQLAWYKSAAEKDLANPEKKKYEANTKRQLAAFDAEIAKRASGAAPATLTPYDKIKAMLATAGIKDPGKFTKQHTGKDHSSKVTDEDVKKVHAALEAELQADVPF